MSKPSVVKVNETLAVLRAMADMSPAYEQDGYRVADIPPLTGRFRSLTEHVSDVLSVPAGSVGKHIAVLANAGFLETGTRGANVSRWVRLDGDFSYGEDK